MSQEETKMQEANELLNDPNCTINIVNTGPIAYYHVPSPANIQDAMNGISQLEFMDIWQLPGFRKTVGSVTLMVWAVIEGGGRTWWIQINGLNGGDSIIAAIDVQGNLTTASTSERMAYVQSMTRLALARSLKEAQTVDVNGPCR
ncbi:hypothetical protein QFZ48_001458 [Chitinophaga sp. W2I13]|uniref:hypothetical protein n=1 Tax=Chitinophaga sp. W2I13 TaxID=3373923 RepID=UPI003D1DEB18